MIISYKYKLSIFSLLIGLTLGYSIYWKSRIDRFESEKYDNILQLLPKVSVKDFISKGDLALDKLTNSSTKGLFIHFWGTWCAPCELELPSFIAFSKKFSMDDVKFVILAVNDKDEDVGKFLKRFSNLPSNVIVAIDEEGASMPAFGTTKVPETYLFNSSGRNLTKFIGPQDWDKNIYFDRVRELLGLTSR